MIKMVNFLKGRVSVFSLLIFFALPALGGGQDATIESDGITYMRFDEALAREKKYRDAYLQIQAYMKKQDMGVMDYYVHSHVEGHILTVIATHKLDLLDKDQWKKTGTSRGSMACEYDIKHKKLIECLVST